MASSALRRLRDFIAIPSINPMERQDIDARLVGERRYAEHVQAELSRLRIDSVIVGQGERQSVVGEAHAGPDAETLLVASHLDTVPVDGMIIDPFDPKVDGNRVYGRGSCDTKAGLAALLAALERVLERGSLKRNVVVVGEADEEFTSIGVSDVLAHLASRRIDWAIATEPTELGLVTQHKGIAAVRLEARGRACHSSDPTQGKNAIVALARAVAALDELSRHLAHKVHPVLGPATLSVGLIGGGQAPNIVPDHGWVVVDRRLLPGETVDSVRVEFTAALARAGVSDVSVTDIKLGKGTLSAAPEHAGVLACQRALSAVGADPTPRSVAFATDGGPFSEHGITTVVLGPGSIDRAHTRDEYVELDQLERMVHVYERLLEGA
jgi:acetylornithine deacetylase/succinyl-diaminopimelate desuccinylase-like protein